MADISEQCEQPTLGEPQLWSISSEELERILAEHLRWFETGGNEGEKADLSRVNLPEADLSRANLLNANFSGANLSDVNLSGADLGQADFSGAILQDADLSGQAQIQEANFSGAYMKRIDLSGANLWRANVQDARLVGANFEQRNIVDESEPRKIAPLANLTRADLRNSDLSDAKLSTVAGLLTGALSGANLSNTKLPADIAKFDGLAHVAETSKNAATIFLGLLGACLYSWLTIATTTDVALIINSANSPPPIINTPILTLPPCSASHSRVRSARGWRRNDEINTGTLHAGVQGRGRSSGHQWRAGGDGRQESRLVGADAA